MPGKLGAYNYYMIKTKMLNTYILTPYTPLCSVLMTFLVEETKLRLRYEIHTYTRTHTRTNSRTHERMHTRTHALHRAAPRARTHTPQYTTANIQTTVYNMSESAEMCNKVRLMILFYFTLDR